MVYKSGVTEKMVQRLRALAALPEDPGSIPTTHMGDSPLSVNLKRVLSSLLVSEGTRHAHGTHTYM